jgi:uncharacterized membrane protein YdbT with pleckstrin-like domain
MMNNGSPFPLVAIKPHWMQFCIGQLHWMLLCTALFIAYLMTSFMFHEVMAYLAVGIFIYLLLEMLSMARIEYVVTGEQIIYLHGLICHQTDYMELYRVIDYQQHRSLMQQITGLKTITIMSGDRNLPNLDIIGVREDEDVVQEIRRRVEYNKKLKSIYEITNRL